MQHYLTYQHNVQKFFRDHEDKYSGVIIPLSIATTFPSGTYGFIRALCSRHPDKQYAIDPRNALFQKLWNRKNVREPHKKIVAVLGEPFITKGLSGPLQPSDFDETSVLEENVKRCLEFQLKFGNRTEAARKLEKYKKLLGVQSLGALGQPHFLIPPYFQFSSFDDPWYSVSQRCIVAAMKFNMGIPVRPVLHFENWKSVGEWTDCHKSLKRNNIGEIWYYPNNFREHTADTEELRAYRDAAETAARNDLKPFSLFGGYFAAIMSYFGLAGFGNGIGYGEWRDSGYSRGGIASTRVYLLKLHRYVDAPAAQDLVDRDPEYFGNDTEIIAGYIDAGVSLINLSLKECLDHFMECRKKEIDFVETQPLAAVDQELQETLSRLEAIGPLELEKYGTSLGRWREVLS